MAFKCSSSMLHVDYRITIWLTYKKQNEYSIFRYILVTFSCKASKCDLASSLRVSCIAEPNFWISLYCMVNDEHIKEFNFSFLKLLSLNIVESWKNINAWTFFRWNTRFFRPFIYGAILKHSDPSLFDHCSKVIEISVLNTSYQRLTRNRDWSRVL